MFPNYHKIAKSNLSQIEKKLAGEILKSRLKYIHTQKQLEEFTNYLILEVPRIAFGFSISQALEMESIQALQP